MLKTKIKWAGILMAIMGSWMSMESTIKLTQMIQEKQECMDCIDPLAEKHCKNLKGFKYYRNFNNPTRENEKVVQSIEKINKKLKAMQDGPENRKLTDKLEDLKIKNQEYLNLMEKQQDGYCLIGKELCKEENIIRNVNECCNLLLYRFSTPTIKTELMTTKYFIKSKDLKFKYFYFMAQLNKNIFVSFSYPINFTSPILTEYNLKKSSQSTIPNIITQPNEQDQKFFNEKQMFKGINPSSKFFKVTIKDN